MSLILEMGKIVCPICQWDAWLFVPNEDVFKKLICTKCKSSIWQMEQYSLDEQYIEWFKSQQI